MIEMDYKYFTCECHTDVLRIDKDEEDNLIYFSMYSRGQHVPKPNLFNRIKYIFNYLRTGRIYSDQFVFTKDTAKEIADYINNDD